MNLNDLLRAKSIDPKQVLVLRHRPTEPELNKVLPWLATKKPEVFNAYQQTQTQKLEKAMQGVQCVASFVGYGSGKALFIGLYSIVAWKPLTYEQFWPVPAHVYMKNAFGMKGFRKETDDRSKILWFDLVIQDFYASWKGKLVVGWPPPGRVWWRRADRNVFPVHAVLEDSALGAAVPRWNEIVLTWEDFKILPVRLESALSQWRGIYFIFDVSDGKGYVGSAYGDRNLLGRWLNYAGSGHGGNRLLRKRDPRNFRFSILELVAPSMDPDDVIRLENTWKERLHARAPHGLNDN